MPPLPSTLSLLLPLLALLLLPFTAALPLTTPLASPELAPTPDAPASPPPSASATAHLPPGARLILRGAAPPQPTTWYNAPSPSWAWSHFLSASPSGSVTLSARTRICPADYASGFAVVCDPGAAAGRANSATFSVDGVVVKVASREWFGPFQVAGHFRGGKAVWEGFAVGGHVCCRLPGGLEISARIVVAC